MRNITMKEWMILFGYILAAFIIRFFFLRYEQVIRIDGVFYASLGKNLIAGNFEEGLSTYWSPLYPFFIGLFSLIFQNLEFSGMMVSVLSGSLLVIPVFFLVRKFCGSRDAHFGAFFVVIYPSLIHCSVRVHTESIYMLFFTTAILVGWNAISGRKIVSFFLTGLLFGACYLIKPEAIGFVGLLIVMELCAKFYFDGIKFRKIVLNIFVVLLGFLILASPYILFLHQKTGRWTISEKTGYNYDSTDQQNSFRLSGDYQSTLSDRLWVGGSSARTPALLSGDLQTNVTQGKSFNLLGTVKQCIYGYKCMLDELIPSLFPPLIIFLIGMGFLKSSWSKEQVGKEIYLVLFVFSFLTGYSLMAFKERHLIPLIPLMIVWISKGMNELTFLFGKMLQDFLEKPFAKKKKKFLELFPVVLISFSLLPAIIGPMKTTKWDQLFEYKLAATWIKKHNTVKKHSKPSPLIMSRKPQTAFYSGGRHLYLPHEEYSIVKEYALKKGVDYIVIDRKVEENIPHLNFLLDENAPHPGLRLLYKYDVRPDNKIIVYELEKDE